MEECPSVTISTCCAPKWCVNSFINDDNSVGGLGGSLDFVLFWFNGIAVDVGSAIPIFSQEIFLLVILFLVFSFKMGFYHLRSCFSFSFLLTFLLWVSMIDLIALLVLFWTPISVERDSYFPCQYSFSVARKTKKVVLFAIFSSEKSWKVEKSSKK